VRSHVPTLNGGRAMPCISEPAPRQGHPSDPTPSPG
jgi:hypothetical protein